jgi:cellulose biosynthesis protein BcsS
MRCVVACVVAAILAADMAACGIEPALAEPSEDGEKPKHFMYFSGADVWRNGTFAHAGGLWAPYGLESEGFRLKLLTGGGFYRYHSDGEEITGRQVLVSLMAGWRFKRETFEITVFAGPDLQWHHFLPDDPGNALRGRHIGVRGGFDLWSEPFPATMVTASLSASTVGGSHWLRAAAGRRMFDVWIGPEGLLCGDGTYQQYRIGAHITALKTGNTEWSLGAGFVTDSDRRSGAYARFGVILRQ